MEIRKINSIEEEGLNKVEPYYNQRLDYTTNAKSYYDFLARFNDYINRMVSLINKLARQDANVEDSDSINIVKNGSWENEDIIKLSANVKKSNQTQEIEVGTRELSKRVLTVPNALRVLKDGLYSPDFTEFFTDYSDKLDYWNDAITGKPYVFETMELAKKFEFKIDDFLVTYGYHSMNDYGHGYYKITEFNGQENDGSHVRFDNGLIAQLVTSSITPQHFGAYGDGINDDSEAIQKCIDYVEQVVVSKGSFENVPEIHLKGNYKITKGIILSPYLKYVIDGNAVITSHLESGTAVHIRYRYSIPNAGAAISSGWVRGDMFAGGCLHIQNSKTTIADNVIGLEINNSENPKNDYHAISRGRIQNISIKSFNIGMKVNCFNFYIFNFSNLVIHSNNYNVIIGTLGFNNVNSGENIAFNNCLFGTCKTGVTINVATLRYIFNQCSFDYNSEGAFTINKQAVGIELNYCHIEDCHASNVPQTGIIGTSSDDVYSKLYLNNVIFYNGNNTNYLASGKNLKAYLHNFTEVNLTNVKNSRNIDTFYLFDNCSVMSNINNTSMLRMTDIKSNLLEIDLQKEPLKVLNVGQSGNIINLYSTKETEVSIKDQISERVIDITQKNKDLFNTQINLNQLIPIDDINVEVCASLMYYMPEGQVRPVLKVGYFNNGKVLIQSKEWSGSSAVNKFTPTSEWSKPVNLPHILECPIGTKYINITWVLTSEIYTPNIKLKNLHVEIKK